jgi:hypothetical protein
MIEANLSLLASRAVTRYAIGFEKGLNLAGELRIIGQQDARW